MTMKLLAGMNQEIDRGVVDIGALVIEKKEKIAMIGDRKKEIEDRVNAVDRCMVFGKQSIK